MKRLLVVGVGTNRDFALTSYKAAGYHVTALDVTERVPVCLVDEAIFLDPRDTALVEARLSPIIHNFDLMLTLDEWSVETVQSICPGSSIRRPVLNPILTRNKYRMRQAFAQAGLITPWYAHVSTVAQGIAEAEQHGYPLVVKPVDYGGSGGVSIVTDPDQLERAVSWAQTKTRQGAIIEQYVDGPEYSVEVIAGADGVRVLGITQKETTPPPYCFEVGHIFPDVTLPDAPAAAVTATAIRAVQAVGIRRGAAHVEVKWSGAGPVVIEVAGRSGGDFIPQLVWYATRVNPYLEEAKAITGEPLVGPLPAVAGAAVKFFYASQDGVLRWHSFSNLNLDGVALLDAKQFWPSGTPVSGNVTSITARLGYAIMFGETGKLIPAYNRIASLGGPEVVAR